MEIEPGNDSIIVDEIMLNEDDRRTDRALVRMSSEDEKFDIRQLCLPLFDEDQIKRLSLEELM